MTASAKTAQVQVFWNADSPNSMLIGWWKHIAGITLDPLSHVKISLVSTLLPITSVAVPRNK